MASYAALNVFNSGELSEKMRARYDVEQYHHGCLKLRNLIVMPCGGVERRRGTRFIGESDGEEDVRLIPFIFSNEVTYLSEWSPLKVKMWR